ncbi:MAG: nicotinate-nucleotide adenylyltransferase [Saprospiraceae bacterium]|nr:nicotinate-nucleotide adenylyltransferase [Saprospiraceae bacterium]MBK9993036.1 nicotinate-nucleotide adenylyltransferase [Saprospiraceae bacterium]
MKIGLYFGSFNPIHTGHLIIAQHILNHTEIQRLWFVISPHNPLKDKASLANDRDRLHLVQLAIEDNPSMKASDIEFKLPQPSYTIDTLTYIKEKYPRYEFALIMGADNLLSLPKWKNYQLLINNYPIYIYKRPNYPIESALVQHENIHILDTPLLDISSTWIRQLIKTKKSIRYLVPEKVFEYLESSHLYRN